ncbi:MAG: response regulator transcription factor [Aureibaculum sp.]|nr:response regulator transcription factor [Aureibaculum sp.]
MDNKITVHIADDHQIIIDGLSAILDFESDIEVVGFSLNGRQVLDWFKNNTADVLLLDINMPDVNGVEVLQGFKEYQTTPHVIVLSSYDNIKLVKDILKIGAKSFVPKKSAGEHIVTAIREVAKGEQYFTDDVKEKMMNAIMGNPEHSEDNSEGMLLSSLTKREYQILKLIALEYTTKKICDTLFISVSTVETHRKNLLKKLKVKNSVGLALFALKNNII